MQREGKGLLRISCIKATLATGVAPPIIHLPWVQPSSEPSQHCIFFYFFFHLTCSLKPKESGFVAILDESEARCVCSERENSFRDDSSPAAKQPPSSTPTQTEFKTCKKKTEKKGAGRRLMRQKILFRVPNKKRGGFHKSALKKKRISASDKRPAFQFKSVTFDNFFSVFFFLADPLPLRHPILFLHGVIKWVVGFSNGAWN